MIERRHRDATHVFGSYVVAAIDESDTLAARMIACAARGLARARTLTSAGHRRCPGGRGARAGRGASFPSMILTCRSDRASTEPFEVDGDSRVC